MIKTTLRRALKALRPPARLRLSEWIEQNIRLPGDVSALPGPVRLYAFQRGIADAISDPFVERVSVQKSARIGYTSTLVGALGSYIINDPAPVLFVLPTEDDARNFVTNNLEPTFAASPTLAGKLSNDTRADTGRKKEKERNTMLARRFPGGSLKIVAAKAPRNLRSHNTRILIMDEVDGMAMTPEGPPIDIAIMRTMQFADRKIVLGSTPVDTATSNIMRAYEQSDQRVFEVPCPGCGEFNEIRWKDIVWPDRQPALAYYCAPCCGTVVEEGGKNALVEGGRWRATKPEVKGHAGFRINTLVSPLANATWGKLAAEWLDKSKSPETLKVFVNTVLGEPWGDGGEEIEETVLYESRQDFGLEHLPSEVLAITAGVDVQHDRLEVTLIGWDRYGVAYVLGHRVLYGRWDDDATWMELGDLLSTRWRHPFGGKLGVDAASVDSSDGTSMDRVYQFCWPRASRRIMAIKGQGGTRPWMVPNKQASRGGVLWLVGVDGIKSALFGRLKTKNHFRFSKDLDLGWFEQLCGERLITHYRKGVPITEFTPVSGRRNEALDCTVYAIAAHKILTIHWDLRESQLREEPQAAPKPRVVESSYLQR